MDLDFNNSLLQKFNYSKSNYKWDVESLDLKQYCISTKKTEDKKPVISNLSNREASFNNSTNTITYINNYGEDFNSNITEEIANIGKNPILNSKRQLINMNVGNAQKRAVINGFVDNGSKTALLENANEKNFENQPVIEKKVNMKIKENEIDVSNKASNITISGNKDSYLEDKRKRLESLNEFKFKEKMSKLKTETKIKVDFSSQKIILIKKNEEICNKKNQANEAKINSSAINNVGNNTNVINQNISTQDIFYNNNIKEEEIKIKETKKVESIKHFVHMNNSNYKDINEIGSNYASEMMEKTEKNLDKVNNEINNHLQMKGNNTNVTMFTSYNLTLNEKKGKANDKKNNMLNNLISLHKFGI